MNLSTYVPDCYKIYVIGTYLFTVPILSFHILPTNLFRLQRRVYT